MTAPVRVGMVGLGTISATHLHVLAHDERFDLTFTVDPNRATPVDFRGSKPPHFAGLSSALTELEPDLLVLATPTETHGDLAVESLTRSSARRVLVEKPIVHDLPTLERLRGLDSGANVAGRLFTAHHFAFSPEVRWAADTLTAHPEWGPVTGVTMAFYDPYVLRGQQAFDSYVSSWMDSGVNQLSVLSRFVELETVISRQHTEGGAGAWAAVSYRSRGRLGLARLRSGWRTGSSSKKTVLTFGDSGVEVWIDHTAMTGFATRGDQLLAHHGNDGSTPRKIAHYRPLYASLVSAAPDPVLGFAAACAITTLHHSPTRSDGATDESPGATA